MNSWNHCSAVARGVVCGGFLNAYADTLFSGPAVFLSKAIFTALTTSNKTEPAFGASTVQSRMSMRMGALPKYTPLIQK